MPGQVRVELQTADFAAGFETAIDRLKDISERKLTAVGLKIQSDARRACPVDTGRLRSSIVAEPVTRDGDKLVLRVGSNVEYAAFVEYGTSRMAPQPYMRPAFLAARRYLR